MIILLRQARDRHTSREIAQTKDVSSFAGLHESALRTAISTEEPSIGYWWKRWNATTCYEAFPDTNNATSA